MNALHISIDGSLALLILLLAVMGFGLGWCVRDLRQARKEESGNAQMQMAARPRSKAGRDS